MVIKRGEMIWYIYMKSPFFIIQRTDNKMTNYYLKTLREYGLTIEQWIVIRSLDSNGTAMTQKELAEIIFLQKGVIN
jgi:DNA-binding MarR family transcriptional regulator